MNRKRLQDLRNLMVLHLESGGTNTRLNGITCSFEMGAWYCHDSCDTSACAYGTWLLSPYNDGPHIVNDNGSVIDTRTDTYHHGFYAAAEDFDLRLSKAYRIFDPGHYPLAYRHEPENMINAVINRIDELLA